MHDITQILKRMFKILESVKKQDPKLYDHLSVVMKEQYLHCPEDKTLYDVGDEVDYAIFISEGVITKSIYDKYGDEKIVSICVQDEIKAGPDFMDGSPSHYLIKACAGTFFVYITKEQMDEVYELFPGTQELAKLIISAHNRKETLFREILLLKTLDLVEAFYNFYPILLEPGTILIDEQIALLLRIGVSSLREYRSELFNTGRLINPATSKKRKLNTISS